MVDDFVVRRNDGAFAYNLAVVVDDAEQGIGEVVRGADLLDSTPRQLWLGARLGLPAPRHAHVPLLLGPDGARLAKRHGAVTLADRAALGQTPDDVRAELAASVGLAEPGERPAPDGAPRALRPPAARGGGRPVRMRWVRTWLPVGIIATGLVIIVATGGSETGVEGGGMLIGAGLSVWLLNLFFRVGVRGDRERDAEDRARAFFDEHGHWPDEGAASAGPARLTCTARRRRSTRRRRGRAVA